MSPVSTHHADAHHDHNPRASRSFLFSTNHKDIGTMYLVFAVVAGPDRRVVLHLYAHGTDASRHPVFRHRRRADGQHWNVVVTAHAPADDLLHRHAGDDRRLRQLVRPLMIGAPDMAFPRMNNISFWLLPVLHPAAGRSRPSSARRRAPAGRSIRHSIIGHSRTACIDMAIFSLHLAGVVDPGAINFITTIFNMRAPA